MWPIMCELVEAGQVTFHSEPSVNHGHRASGVAGRLDLRQPAFYVVCVVARRRMIQRQGTALGLPTPGCTDYSYLSPDGLD